MVCRRVSAIVTWVLLVVLLVGAICGIPEKTNAADDTVHISGRVYEFGKNDHYSFHEASSFNQSSKNNTYGSMYISGSLSSDGSKDGIPSYKVNTGNVTVDYTYTDELRDAPEERWHLVEDKSKEVAGIKLSSNIRKGAVILQSSKDGVTWMTDASFTDYFAHSQGAKPPIYSTNSIQLANGCYYRLIIAYELAKKVGQNQVLVVKTDKIEYIKRAEVYEFYLHDAVQSVSDTNMKTRALGTLVRAEKEDNGYSGEKTIDIKDPHYGWELGQFFVSGYTRATRDDSGNPVFLKNVGDQITLWFNLKQNIDSLNHKDSLSIADDDKGYDRFFQIEKTDMGRGTLIIRYTDEKGVKHDPEIYTNYLLANATTSANTVVKLFEEGDYEVALDYKIKSVPRKVIGVEIVPEYYDYRIYFTFSVRNGNCMVYPFDVKTGVELTDEAITPNGFRLDMAKSRYLTIDVKKSVVTIGANGYVEDVRFNRPAKDGDQYVDEGIYTFSVKNLYTGENTTKCIYVGKSNYMRALSVNKITVSELNNQIAAGAVIADNGTIILPVPENKSETASDVSKTSPVKSAIPKAVGTNKPADNNLNQGENVTDLPGKAGGINLSTSIAIIACVVAVVAVVVAIRSRKGKEKER